MTDPHQINRRLVPRNSISEALLDPDARTKLGLPADDNTPIPIVIELNVRYRHGVIAAAERLLDLLREAGEPEPAKIALVYYRCELTMVQVRALVQTDRAGEPTERVIFRLWPDFPVRPLIDRSVTTVKGDAALRAYQADGAGITWAVVDSGIDATHPHFEQHENLTAPHVRTLHRDFTSGDDPLRDDTGHGTHVAGILAGGLPPDVKPADLHVCYHEQDETGTLTTTPRQVTRPETLTGVAPRCALVSLKALDADNSGSSSGVMRALEYVHEVNGEGKDIRIHGVNLSVGYEFQARWFACGQSPLCVAVNRLVRSGVVVVIAAGNTGYGVSRADQGTTPTGLTLTINDPGNADAGITVGATHRDSPHTYGVSYFSSKGPTGDGRDKPDLVAPGENITSCAAGTRRESARRGGKALPARVAAYIDESGTSMAAPHVSGAAAAFLSIRREFIGHPEKIKRIFLDTATPLGRSANFQGHGLVDLMRAIQAV